MRILKEVILYVTIILAASCESRPISPNHYAPAHEYKSIDYSFSYGVKDPHTGDVKNQWEEKKDNVVRGEYSLLEADGSTRTVQYTADDKNGFNAVVKYDQHSIHPIAESQEPLSHKNVNLNPSRDSIAYSSYTNNLEGSTHLGHSEVQTVVQHEYKLPESYNTLQTLSTQHIKSLGENTQVQNEGLQRTTYIYVPQEENASEENKLDQSQIQAQTEPSVQTYYAYESDQNTAPPQDEEQHESQHQEVKQVIEPQQQNDVNVEYAISNIQAQIPLHSDSANRIPVNINSLNPINIDLTQILKQQLNNDESNKEPSTEIFKYSTKDNSVQPSHQLTPEEVQKFIDDYNNKLNEPVFESGFVPITTKPNHQITQPMIPNTYRSNLKVNMTPGLKHYSSRSNSKFKRNKYEAFVLGQQQLVPVYLTTGDSRKDGHRSEYLRLHRSVPNKNPFLRYAKHIRFIN